MGLLLAAGLTPSVSAAVSPAASAATAEAAPAAAGHTGPWGKLSNGCYLGQRGLPGCGTYLGAGIGANTDPTRFETTMGKRISVHRVYWSAGQVDSALSSARTDLARGRLPWMSFKMPYSWSDMAAGRGDAWARSLASRLNTLPGPVWVAFHHEPEGDGDITKWTAMQERLAPIVRRNATNVGFSVILTGWDELYGDPRYRLSSIWPKNTQIDIAGFDVYNRYLVTSNGTTMTTAPDLDERYFQPLAAWARANGVRWGLAETGYSHPASERQPRWIEQTYREVQAAGGVAMTYFDSTLNSIARWDISTPSKQQDFARALRLAPDLPLLR